MTTFVIVGASLTGAKAAEQLRKDGFDGRVVLVGAEPHRPYERPPLSKGFLLGKDPIEKAFVHPESWYDENRVELRLATTATAIDPARHEVRLSGGEALHYDKLLLATGSLVRELAVPGADQAGIVYLRDMGQSVALRKRLHEGVRVLIVGAGWIGLEAAAAAREHGASVTVVEMDSLPLRRVLGDELAAVYRDLHQARGVQFRFDAGLKEFLSTTEGPTGTVTRAVLADGSEIVADLVLAGVGVAPNVELARNAGLEVLDGRPGGVVVDEHLRTSDPDIYAAGDVAAFWSPLIGERIRVEHWANALNGGKAAGSAMAGSTEPYNRVPYFYSDQYTTSPMIGMEYSGHIGGGYDQVVFRGTPAIEDGKDPEFLAFWTKQGRVLAGMNANIWDVHDQIQQLVRAGFAGRAVDLNRLADPAVPLTDLL